MFKQKILYFCSDSVIDTSYIDVSHSRHVQRYYVMMHLRYGSTSKLIYIIFFHILYLQISFFTSQVSAVRFHEVNVFIPPTIDDEGAWLVDSMTHTITEFTIPIGDTFSRCLIFAEVFISGA